MSKNYPLCVLIEIKHVKEDEEFYVTAEIKDSQVRFQHKTLVTSSIETLEDDPQPALAMTSKSDTFLGINKL